MGFDIGDKVIYPNHGLGVIERIETKTIMGTTCGFYQLRMANETTVFVPVDNVDGVGLRRARRLHHLGGAPAAALAVEARWIVHAASSWSRVNGVRQLIPMWGRCAL